MNEARTQKNKLVAKIIELLCQIDLLETTTKFLFEIANGCPPERITEFVNKEGVDPTTRACAAVFLSCERGLLDSLKHLVSFDSVVQELTKPPVTNPFNYNPPTRLQAALNIAVTNGHLPIVQYLWDNYPPFRSPLRRACLNDRVDILSFLFERDPVETLNAVDTEDLLADVLKKGFFHTATILLKNSPQAPVHWGIPFSPSKLSKHYTKEQFKFIQTTPEKTKSTLSPSFPPTFSEQGCHSETVPRHQDLSVDCA